MVLDHLVKDIPDFRELRVDHFLGGLNILDRLALNQSRHDERLEQLQRHYLWQATLIKLQMRAGDNHGPPGVIHSLAEKVLTEPSLLPLEHVR